MAELGPAQPQLVSMKNHIYSFNGKMRIQEDGGATGLDETGDLADLFMLWWDENFIKLLKLCEIVPDIYARFKDDGSIITDRLTEAHTGIYNVLDKNCIDTNDKDPNFTAKILCQLANKVNDMISFTFDTPHLNEDQKLPILDVKVSLNDSNVSLNDSNILEHEFYEKPTRNPRVILATSALSWSQKRTIHTQEILRRLRNTS